MSREIREKGKLNNNPTPSQKTLIVQEISHAMVLADCPKCGKSISITADNMEPYNARCWCCDFRFIPTIKSVEISYREVLPDEQYRPYEFRPGINETKT